MKKIIMIIAATIIQIAAFAATPQQCQCPSPELQKEAEKQAQQRMKKAAERQEHQIKFVVNMLKLDDATAAKFTPIYREYINAKSTLRRNGMKNRRPQKGKITDAEAAKIVKERLNASRKILDIREKYYNKMAKVITPTQLLKIYDMEQNFDNKMRSMWGNRTQGKRQGAGAHHPGPHRQGNKRTAQQEK